MTNRDEEFGISLVNTILTADGLILTLSWGLFDWNMTDASKEVILHHLQWGSTSLSVSLLAGVLCPQFMITTSQSNNCQNKSVMKAKNVSVTFLICWIFFIIAIVIFTLGIWRI
jgi:ABC-type methionine transport system permease subunit